MNVQKMVLLKKAFVEGTKKAVALHMPVHMRLHSAIFNHPELPEDVKRVWCHNVQISLEVMKGWMETSSLRRMVWVYVKTAPKSHPIQACWIMKNPKYRTILRSLAFQAVKNSKMM